MGGKFFRGRFLALAFLLAFLPLATGCIGDAQSTLGEAPAAYVPPSGEFSVDLKVSLDSVSFGVRTSSINNGPIMTLHGKIENLGKAKTYGFERMFYWVHADNPPPYTDFTGYDHYLDISYDLYPGEVGSFISREMEYSLLEGTAHVLLLYTDQNDFFNDVKDQYQANNVSTLAWVAPPDLTVAIDSAVHDGANLTITYTLSNVGGSDAGAFDLALWLNLSGYPDTTTLDPDKVIAITGLAAGATLTDSVTLPNPTGAGKVWGLADYGATVVEILEDNNYGGLDYAVERDLTVVVNSVTAVDSTNYSGTTLTLNYTVTNTGSIASGPFTVGLSASGTTTWSKEVSFASMEVGAVVTSEETFNTSLYKGNAYAFVDLNQVVPESDEVNTDYKPWDQILFDSDFDYGSYPQYLDSDWPLPTGTGYTSEISKETKVGSTGTSLKQLGGDGVTHNNARYHVMNPPISPSRVEFWIYNPADTDSGYVVFTRNSVVALSAHFGGFGGVANIFINEQPMGTYTIRNWYPIVFDNIDWVNHTANLYIDGVSKGTGVAMQNPVDSLDKVDLYNLSLNSTAHWDEILITK